ncbi:TIGR02594 family protein [Sinorhizobium meliloti]|nr:TIGR02594 family protein [Sinorhizobium meliloti]MDW9800328.1 TIGR02594 family protein [Sinorhizobium meliloti]
MKIAQIQKALIDLGFKPGPLDGIWGRQTIAAIRAFQNKVGLEPDGIIGPLTLEKLFPHQSAEPGLERTDIVWFKEARRLLGTREKPGVGSNPDILDWATDVDVMYASDDIPWCGLFVGHCIASTLDREALPTNVLGARAWASFGIKTKPTPGAVMVFWRKSRQSGFGHVGFYAGEDEEAYRILGGNQSDSVSLAWVSKDRFLAARWPATVPAPVPNPVAVASRTDSLSWDEA